MTIIEAAGREPEVFYHGTSAIFNAFSHCHTLEGAGKVKFGYGVYVTERYATAAHYAIPQAQHHYVYTVEVPRKTVTNYIAVKEAVHPSIIKKAEEQLGENIPAELTTEGKLLRKFLALRLAGKKWSKTQKPSISDEKLASELLNKIGVDFIEWPINWRMPTERNRAILDVAKVNIIKIEEIQLDNKGQLILDAERKLIYSAI